MRPWGRSHQPGGGKSKWHQLAGHYHAPVLLSVEINGRWTRQTVLWEYYLTACGYTFEDMEIVPSALDNRHGWKTGQPLPVPAGSAPHPPRTVCDRCSDIAEILSVSTPL